MDTVADYAGEFVRRARRGEKPSVVIDKQHAAPFLASVAELGLPLAEECLQQISDPDLRHTIEAIFFGAAAGALGGAAIGAVVDGERGAKAGAVAGAAIGAAAGAFACTLKAVERNGKLVVSVP